MAQTLDSFRRLGTAAVALTTLLGVALPSVAAPFLPKETLASSNRRLLDPEFNQGKGLLTWVDIVDGSIWVGSIDKATGNLVPEDGKGVLIEREAAPPGGLGFTLNGPEWVLGGTTDRIVYTRFLPGVEPTAANAQLGAAFQREDGKWVVRTISADRRLNAPYGSDTVGDPAPRISYNDALGNHFWREIDKPETERPIPGLSANLLPAVRHVRSSVERALAYPINVGGIPQIVMHNVDTQAVDQITFGGGKKEQPWVWRAPDFNGDLVMMTTVDETTIQLHRKLGGAGSTSPWTQVQTIQVPVSGRFFSTEPFVYGGKSYAVMMIIEGAYPTSIWLTNFDPAAPIMRRLTPAFPDRARADPEVFFTDNGPIVFFSRFNQNKGNYWLCVPCAEGLYRADTGIPFSP